MKQQRRVFVLWDFVANLLLQSMKKSVAATVELLILAKEMVSAISLTNFY